MQFAELLAGVDGSQRHPELAWPAGAYVCQVTDNLRIWAERVAGAALGVTRKAPGCDENLLAQARAYPLGSLGRCLVVAAAHSAGLAGSFDPWA